MKRSTVIKLLASILGVSLVASVTSTIAWFVPIARIENTDSPIEGATEGAYFAYGDGSSGSPYGIKKPRHLYNLAWLNYLGYFNDSQVYFELDNDLSMEGWTIPPIGTSTYPFVGHFNGKDYIISDCTISNQFSDYGTKHPGVVTSTNFVSSSVKIVGFFGVIGNYNGAYGGASYSSIVNTVYDLGLTDITVKTTSSDTLIGMVAGYVDADITNVAVDTGSLNVATGAGSTVISPATKVSEFGIVGYTTKKKDICKVNETIYSVNVSPNHEFNANDAGDSDGWGGSINMVSLYQRIYNMTQISSAQSPFTWKNRTDHNVDGTTTNTPSTYTSGTYGNNTYTFRSYSGRPAAGNLHYVNRNDTKNYSYIGGGYVQQDRYYYLHEGKRISDGTNYLILDNGSIANSTTSSSATLWSMPEVGSAGTISTQYNGTTYYLRDNEGNLELYAGDNQSYRTQWTITDQGNDEITISHNTYKIHYYNNVWRLIPTTNQSYFDHYVVQSGSNYIRNNSSSGAIPTNTTDANQAANFYVEESTNYVYFLNGNTKMYLAYYYTSRLFIFTTQELRMINSTGQSNYYYFTYSNGALSTTRSGTTYYAYYNSGWTYTTTANQSASLTAVYETDNFAAMYLASQSDDSRSGPDDYLTSQMSYTATNTTYLPLNVKSDGGGTLDAAGATTKLSSGNYDPKDSNTGYIVSGYSFDESLNSLTGMNANQAANIRVSKYPISDIGNSYTSNDGGIIDSKVYTINTSNQIVTVNGLLSSFKKYSDSKADFYSNALSGAENIFGLHFMDAQISSSALVPAQNISIFGEIRKNQSTNAYQMPVNSIDFNLKQRGFINFFAGTYFPDNNSFFSLHKINRASNTDISAVKEIVAIYGDSNGHHSYVYEYSDGTYSKPYYLEGSGDRFEINANGTVKTQINAQGEEEKVPFVENDNMSSAEIATYIFCDFNSPLFLTSQIAANASIASNYMNRIFYFEIPVNEGEYCLGSVNGGTGSYLMYLDIGANAAKTQRTVDSEHFTITEVTTTYPIGVAFMPYDDSGIDDTDTVSMTVPTGFAGKTLKVTRTGNTVSVTENDVTTLSGDLISLGDSIIIASNIEEKLKPKSSVSKDIKRIQYYDYNVNMDETTRTIITDTTIGNSTTRVVEQYDASGNAVSESNWKIYRTNNGNKYDASDIKSTSSVSLASLGWVDPGNTVLVSFRYRMDQNTSRTETLALNMAVDDSNTNGKYYEFSGYAFVITPTGGSITIKVTAKGSGSVTINGTAVNAVNQTITVNPAS